jgi:putative tryptophan/tyrosine transport system substrate-binding protein
LTGLAEVFGRSAREPQAGRYIDRILEGARPTDLPAIQPTRYYLAVNLKTATSLGLTMPPSLLLRTDELIQ